MEDRDHFKSENYAIVDASPLSSSFIENSYKGPVS